MPTALFFMITVGLPVVCGTLIVLALIFMNATRNRKGNNMSNDEARILQEMHQSLLRMEKRIDALETIYFDVDRKNKGDFS